MRLAFLMAFLLAASPVGAAAQTPAITIENAWIMTPPPGADVAGAYMMITSARPDRLLAVTCACAGEAALHEMSMQGGVMRMRQLRYGIALPARRAVTLSAAGLHVMLTELTAPLAEGQRVHLRLTFRDAGDIGVDAVVRRRQ